MIYSEAVIMYMVVSDFISLKPFGCLNVVSELCIMYVTHRLHPSLLYMCMTTLAKTTSKELVGL